MTNDDFEVNRSDSAHFIVSTGRYVYVSKNDYCFLGAQTTVSNSYSCCAADLTSVQFPWPWEELPHRGVGDAC